MGHIFHLSSQMFIYLLEELAQKFVHPWSPDDTYWTNIGLTAMKFDVYVTLRSWQHSHQPNIIPASHSLAAGSIFLPVYLWRGVAVHAGRWWVTHGGVHTLWALNRDSCCRCFSPRSSYLFFFSFFFRFCSKIPWTTSFSLRFTSVCLPFNWFVRRPSSPKVRLSCQDTDHEKEFQDLCKSMKDSDKYRQTWFCL